MATTKLAVNTDTSLDVTGKFNELVGEALGADSPYIRAKETLYEMFDRFEIDNGQKAELVATTISGLAANLTNSAMSTALQWESQQKDLSMRKEELEYKLAILENEIAKSNNDAGASEANKHAVQAKTIREYGNPTVVDGNVASLNNTGLAYEQIQKIKQETANAADLNTQIEAQTRELDARTHKLVADTYVNHGMYTGYTISSNGITGTTQNSSHTTLSDMQKYTAREQIKGYTYNARSNVITASASMLGTLAATEAADAAQITNTINLWEAAVTYLNTNAVIPTDVTV